MEYGKRLNPEHSLRTAERIKGTRQNVIVTHNPSEIDQAQLLRCVKAWVQNLMKSGIQNLICMHFILLFCKNHHEILTVNVNHHC